MYQEIFGFIIINQLPEIIWDIVLWTLVGSISGSLFGLAVYFRIREWGGYRLEWRYTAWLRALTAILAAGSAFVCGGLIGFYDGAWRGVQQVAVQGDFGTRLMPTISGYGAQLIAGVYSLYLVVEEGKSSRNTEHEIRKKMITFAHGEWEIDVYQMQERISNTPKYLIDAAIRDLLIESRIRDPAPESSATQKILLWFLQRVGEGILPAEVNQFSDAVQESSLVRYTRKILRDLPSEAAKTGNPQTIGYNHLSVYLARESMQPFFVKPIRGIARAHQVGVVIWLLFTLAVPVGAFRLAEYLRQRRARARAANPV
ncbi:MAG: hypothetical protein ACYC0V_11010 [Armatimonadota bacterium]